MAAETVLVVDDEKLVRWSLRQKYEEWGFTVLEAENGAAGLRLAQSGSPDLILLDVRMPDLSGLEVLQRLKETADARAVIMITADPQLDDVKAAIKLGAFDFIGKPIDFDELHVTTQNALEATRLRSEVESLRSEMQRRVGYRDVVAIVEENVRADGLRAQGGGQRSFHRPDPGRERHRQGPDRQSHPLPELAPRQGLRRHQLFGHPREPDGSRALRPREGRLHRRQGA